MKILLFLFCLYFINPCAYAQQNSRALDMTLQPYKLVGYDSPVRRNLSFADYKTQGIHRTLGSLFSFGNFSIINPILVVDGIPLYKKDKMWAKDVFHFELKKGDTITGRTECRAIMHKNETFRLFWKQDSSFFGTKNVDYLDARIQLVSDTADIWQMAASNLNGSKDEEQKGIMRSNNNEEITFVKTVLMLRDKPVDRTDPESLFATANIVYAFTYKSEIVAAVTFKQSDKKIWLKEDLKSNIKNVITHAACVLTIRRELYY
ncbi:hypothetical protein ACI6Q2_16445 [Chitinophagaceae bacterium LWZ2-11]